MSIKQFFNKVFLIQGFFTLGCAIKVPDSIDLKVDTKTLEVIYLWCDQQLQEQEDILTQACSERISKECRVLVK
jgi:hypothetical protein